MDYQELYQYLPSRRIGILVAVILGVFVLFVGVRNRQAIFSLFTGADKQATSSRIAALKKADTDNDGLSDWEERLWGTDKNNLDSDGDGTPDGKEVENNRDPNQPGPDDRLAKVKKNSSKSSTRQNITRELSSEILPRAVKLAAAEQSGTNITQNELDFTSKKIQQRVDLQRPAVTQRSELKITNEQSPQRVQRYFDRFNEAVQVLNSRNKTSPLKVIAKAQQEGKLGEVDLTPYVRRHQKAINQLKTVAVPKPFVEVHLKTLHSLERALYGLRRMNNIDTDPIGAVVGTQEYKKAIRLDREATKLLQEKIQAYAESLQ